jgi:hypothetical protein
MADDAELANRILAGDRESAGEIYDRYAPLVPISDANTMSAQCPAPIMPPCVVRLLADGSQNSFSSLDRGEARVNRHVDVFTDELH